MSGWTTDTPATDAEGVSRRRAWSVVAVAAVAIAAVLLLAPGRLTDSSSPAQPAADAVEPTPSATSEEPPSVATQSPTDPVTVVGGDAPAQALGVSQAIWRASDMVVVADADDPTAVDAAVEAAGTLAAPVLLTRVAPRPTAPPSPTADDEVSDVDPALAQELARLGTSTVVAMGVPAQALPDGVSRVEASDARAQAPMPSEVVVLTTGDTASAAARASAEAAGAQAVVVEEGDPRADPDAIAALSQAPDEPVLALGDPFGPVERLAPLVEVAATGIELPGGGQTLFPGRRLVALYGHPSTTALGVLGEQGPQASVERAREVAASYQPFSAEPVVPAFEIIATVAADQAGADGNYSNETPIDILRPYVDAAGEAEVYVVLDLQPGRSGFLTQAKRYQELLELPHVGLALDPEWRLEPDQVPLQQIGTVDAAEIDQVADWLAGLVRERALPQKLLLLHQFQTRMISNRDTLDLSRDELAVLVQMDGDGAPGDKFATWDALRAGAPANLRFGWKNFYDEDTPTFTPEQTMAVTPAPWWVSYQ